MNDKNKEVEENSEKDNLTARTVERDFEEKKYSSVIIKRNDEVSKHPDDVLQNAIDEGLEHVNKGSIAIYLSSISGGLIIGFAAMAIAFIISILPMDISDGYKRLAMAIVYPFGFIICILSKSDLFTEHTALALYPGLDGKCNFYKVIRLWFLVLFGNLTGTFISSVLLSMVDPITQASSGYLYVAHHLIGFESGEILISAILAGWLMALGGWIILGLNVSSAQILSIYIVTFLIGIGGLHHSIAGSAEVFTAFLLGDDIKILDITRFLSLAITGNLIGGSFFVAVLNYAHIRRAQKIND